MYNILVLDGEEVIDFIQLRYHTIDSAFDYLNKLWDEDEREGRFYTYELRSNDDDDYIIFSNTK